MHTSDILKGKLNRKPKTNTSRLVTTIIEILKTTVQKLDKPIFLFKITNNAAAINRKTITAFNGKLGAAIVEQK